MTPAILRRKSHHQFSMVAPLPVRSAKVSMLELTCYQSIIRWGLWNSECCSFPKSGSYFYYDS